MSDASTEDLRKAARRVFWATKELEAEQENIVRWTCKLVAMNMACHKEEIVDDEMAKWREWAPTCGLSHEEQIQWVMATFCNKFVLFAKNMSETIDAVPVVELAKKVGTCESSNEWLDGLKKHYSGGDAP